MSTSRLYMLSVLRSCPESKVVSVCSFKKAVLSGQLWYIKKRIPTKIGILLNMMQTGKTCKTNVVKQKGKLHKAIGRRNWVQRFVFFALRERLLKIYFPFAFLQKVFSNGHTKVTYTFYIMQQRFAGYSLKVLN